MVGELSIVLDEFGALKIIMEQLKVNSAKKLSLVQLPQVLFNYVNQI